MLNTDFQMLNWPHIDFYNMEKVLLPIALAIVCRARDTVCRLSSLELDGVHGKNRQPCKMMWHAALDWNGIAQLERPLI
jgi:hypothetical protein